MERLLGTILRVGVATAGAVVLAGVLLSFRARGRIVVDYGVFRGEPSDLRGLRGILRATRELHPRGVIQLGLLILVATPVARVVLAALAFARARDWLYTAIALIVFAGLLVGLLGL
jgi:uncharacterized membrane protein